MQQEVIKIHINTGEFETLMIGSQIDTENEDFLIEELKFRFDGLIEMIDSFVIIIEEFIEKSDMVDMYLILYKDKLLKKKKLYQKKMKYIRKI